MYISMNMAIVTTISNYFISWRKKRNQFMMNITFFAQTDLPI